jgi:hypothetical protein
LSAEAQQHRVDELLVLQCKLRQNPRHCKDDVRVRNRKKFFLPRVDPTHAGVGLAFRAMPIATGVIGVAGISAFRIRAFIQVIAEISRATALDRSKNLQMLPRDPFSAVFDELFPDGADNVGHFEQRPLHLRVRIGCFI